MNVLRLLHDNDLIYIDTASLMNPINLHHFLANYEEDFTSSQKMIIVSEAVCQELLRHINSNNEDKADKAIQALNLIRENNNIFSLEQSNFSPEEIQHAFADQELLVRLSMERRFKRQLLITNDRSLSKDAYDLNMFQSCKGKKISICYVNYYGYLIPSRLEEEKVYAQEPATVEPSLIKDEQLIETEVSDEPANSVWGYICVALGAFAFGFGTSCYGKSIITNFKSVL